MRHPLHWLNSCLHSNSNTTAISPEGRAKGIHICNSLIAYTLKSRDGNNTSF
uniref:Uncharacterized protein n=1 Tax=Rhizophora mucronata TaxID=61149 RepID=A0A2P2NUL0_RHIMU